MFCFRGLNNNDDVLGCFKLWRKFESVHNNCSQFVLDVATIHNDPQNFFVLLSIAKSEHLELLMDYASSVKPQTLTTVKLRLLFRAFFLSQSAVLYNKSFFSERYQKVNEEAADEIHTMRKLNPEEITESVIDEIKMIERSNSALFDPFKLDPIIITDLFDNDCSLTSFGPKCVFRSFSYLFLSFFKE